jgi:hypothetical protein
VRANADCEDGIARMRDRENREIVYRECELCTSTSTRRGAIIALAPIMYSFWGMLCMYVLVVFATCMDVYCSSLRPI